MNKTITVVFDNNAWISFCMKGRLRLIETLFPNPQIRIYACQNLINEFDNISSRDYLQKYLNPERVETAKTALQRFNEPFEMLPNAKQICRDPKDDYFLYFSEQYNLDFIVTGDKDLLVLEKHGLTQIITFNEFMSILGGKGLI